MSEHEFLKHSRENHDKQKQLGKQLIEKVYNTIED